MSRGDVTKQELLGRWWYRLLQVLFVISLLASEVYVSFQGPPWFTITGTLTYEQSRWVERLGADARSEGKPEAEVRQTTERTTKDYQEINYISLGAIAGAMVFVYLAFLLFKRIFQYVAIAQPVFRRSRHLG